MVLGVAIGRSRSQLGLFDLEGREIAGDSSDHAVGIGPDELLPDVAARLGAPPARGRPDRSPGSG